MSIKGVLNRVLLSVPIVAIRRTGARASYAAAILRMVGYTNVWGMIDAKMPPAGGIPSVTLIFGNEVPPK